MFCLIRSNLRRAIRSKAVWVFAAGSVSAAAAMLLLYFHGPDWFDNYSYYRSFYDLSLLLMIPLTVHVMLRNDISGKMLVPRLTAGNTREQIYFAELISAAAAGLFLWILFYAPWLAARAIVAREEPVELYTLYAAAGMCSVIGICALCTLLECNVKSRVITLSVGFLAVVLYFVSGSVLDMGEANMMRIFGAIVHLFPPVGSITVTPTGEPYFGCMIGALWEYPFASLLFAAMMTGLGLLLFRKRDLS